jgi:hypothetical protein
MMKEEVSETAYKRGRGKRERSRKSKEERWATNDSVGNNERL